MEERGLMLSEEKTKITHISDGFDFLGFNIRKYSNGKLLTKPSKEAMKSFCDKMRTKVKGNKSAKASSVIRMLNRMIPGWGNYYRYGASSKAFSRVDYEIHKTLWQWAKRRHPGKGKKWIKEKYFKQLHGRDWCFAAITKSKKTQKEHTLSLKRLANIAIQKYVRVRTNANPCDPADATYYKRRTAKDTEQELRETDNLLAMIWIHQKMRCPICGEIIDNSRRWATITENTGGEPFKTLIHSSCKPKKFKPNKIK
jgi:RNA-directed DNA polymerase